jgi:hypothetical protein
MTDTTRDEFVRYLRQFYSRCVSGGEVAEFLTEVTNYAKQRGANSNALLMELVREAREAHETALAE